MTGLPKSLRVFNQTYSGVLHRLLEGETILYVKAWILMHDGRNQERTEHLRATLETFLGLVLPECARKGHSSMPAVRLSSLDLQTNRTVAILMPMGLQVRE
jgi:hypothetical protein